MSPSAELGRQSRPPVAELSRASDAHGAMRGRQVESRSTEPPQYSPLAILAVWAAAALPMALLGWVLAPALAAQPSHPGTERLAVLTIGLAWQFILVLVLVRHEAGRLSWRELRARLWLQTPRSPRSGRPQRRLWWWLVPLLLATALFEMVVTGVIDDAWQAVLPFLKEPANFAFATLVDTPAKRAGYQGDWGLLALFLVSAILNTVIGEELLFRGLLLPRMRKACGRLDWLANGALFGLYHLHQPWMMLSAAIEGAFLFAWPTRRFRSSWFGIIAHSGQSVFFAVLILGIVLGRG